MKYKVSTLFSIGLVVFVTHVSNGMQSEQLQNSRQLFQKKAEETYRMHNRRFYQGSSTEIGKGCFSGLLDIARADFWCNDLAVMAKNQEKLEALTKRADTILGGRYSNEDIREFVAEISNRKISS